MAKQKIIYIILALSPIPVFFFSLFLGAYEIPPLTIIYMLFKKIISPFTRSPWPETYGAILFDIRIPRIILAMLVGVALSSSGAPLQAIFRNPLVDPYILGLSSGAAFGCAISIAFLPGVPIQLCAFIFGLLAAFITYGIAKTRREVPTLSLVLAGIIVSALFFALVSIIKFMVDPHKLSTMVYWLMGSLSLSDWKAIYTSAPWIFVGCAPLFLMRWRLNALSMGDEEAKSLGIDVGRERGMFIAASALAVASAVSVSGIIGWVGLMIPHMVRMLIGPDHKRLIPLSMTVGASFMLLADDLARIVTTFEIPVGIITTISGAPFFIYLLKRGGVKVWAP